MGLQAGLIRCSAQHMCSYDLPVVLEASISAVVVEIILQFAF
jgi:hypothetical protein